MAEVVHLRRAGDAIAVIEMADRDGRNTFTQALVAGLGRALQQVADDPDLRVVVIHGYDSYFSAGGTLQELLEVAEHKQTFDAHNFYRALLDCPLPVVAAMQGHALGGGLVFGLYADVVVLSEESLYGANFTKYGFTPGTGATLLLPMKFGTVLASEMLFSARSYHGGRLKERGIAMSVVPRAGTIATAMALAKDLADKPAPVLRMLKRELNGRLLQELPAAVEREKAMQAVSFAQPGISERIASRFGR